MIISRHYLLITIILSLISVNFLIGQELQDLVKTTNEDNKSSVGNKESFMADSEALNQVHNLTLLLEERQKILKLVLTQQDGIEMPQFIMLEKAEDTNPESGVEEIIELESIDNGNLEIINGDIRLSADKIIIQKNKNTQDEMDADEKAQTWLIKGGEEGIKMTIHLKRGDRQVDAGKGIESFNAQKEAGNIANLEMFPNPSNGKFNLHFFIQEKEDTRISIYDPLGNTVFQEEVKDFEGDYQRSIDLRGLKKLNQGSYFLRIVQPCRIFTEQIIIK